MGGKWAFEHHVGDPAAFHLSEPAAQRALWWFESDRRALVLGSAQREATVNRRVADALGVDVVRRRSGGGGVLLLPGEIIWLDVIVPAGDELWDDDVARSMIWVGEWWQGAFASLGVATTVHHAALVHTPWSADVCFSGTGTGEVLIGSRKLVGIAQRRTRHWARFQTMCHLRWRPEVAAALVVAPGPAGPHLAAAVATIDVEPAAVVAALRAALPA